MKKIFWGGFCFLSLIFLITVFYQNAESNPNKGNNMEEKYCVKYYFEMNEDQKNIFFSKLESVKIGSSIEYVLGTMGKPTYDQKLIGKKGDFTARKLTYYIKKCNKDLVNERYDQSVQFLFNIKNTLVEIKSDIK